VYILRTYYVHTYGHETETHVTYSRSPSREQMGVNVMVVEADAVWQVRNHDLPGLVRKKLELNQVRTLMVSYQHSP
jgi:hypothetical protein